jgi:hypothetical protein
MHDRQHAETATRHQSLRETIDASKRIFARKRRELDERVVKAAAIADAHQSLAERRKIELDRTLLRMHGQSLNAAIARYNKQTRRETR